jgi:hypothetical protein
MAGAYRDADLVLQLSAKPESFGRTVVEALCSGRAVVGWDHGGVGELLARHYPAGRVPLADEAALLATALRVLAGLSFVAAVVLALATARRRRLPPDPDSAGDVASADPGDERFAMMEVAHERDVSIARATEAEDRERLARDRLAALLPLEQRLEVAERRALDAERRLEEITERLAAERDEEDDPVGGGGAEGGAADPSEAAARRAAELRARLGRGGTEKKRDP